MQLFCIITGCTAEAKARNMCSKHYEYARAHGDFAVGPIGRQRGPETQVTSHRYLARRIAEDTLGKSLPAGAVVHHVDLNPANNNKDNLVICPSEEYHNLLHIRTDAFLGSGHYDWRRCYVCKAYDDVSRLRIITKAGRNPTTFYHSECRSLYRQERKELTGRKI